MINGPIWFFFNETKAYMYDSYEYMPYVNDKIFDMHIN